MFICYNCVGDILAVMTVQTKEYSPRDSGGSSSSDSGEGWASGGGGSHSF